MKDYGIKILEKFRKHVMPKGLYVTNETMIIPKLAPYEHPDRIAYFPGG
jgi:hypothetical protein